MLVFLLVLGVAVEGVRRVLPDSSKPSANPHGPQIKVVIPAGANAVQIGGILEQRGVVQDGERFRNYVKEQGLGAEFKAGTYRFQAGIDYDRIVERLNAGPLPPKVFKLVVPEGFRITDIEQRLGGGVGITRGSYRGALREAQPPAGFGHPESLEGFLFPATYDVRKPDTGRDLVAAQLAAFARAFDRVDMAYAASKNLTPYDVLIIASMIEREAKVDRERPLVAAVIYNRLAAGMPLGIDATLLYEQGDWAHRLTVSELEADSPYNTRLRTGLPPTPISNPGLASLQAAAHPAEVNYLYYVAEGDSGAHYFTESFEDFRAHGG